jgi:hypothetical protein
LLWRFDSGAAKNRRSVALETVALDTVAGRRQEEPNLGGFSDLSGLNTTGTNLHSLRATLW